eukprot:5545739-Prorocentrum_lima.AAC.1
MSSPMSINRTGATSFQDEADSQGDPFEAARGQTNRFTEAYLPKKRAHPSASTVAVKCPANASL